MTAPIPTSAAQRKLAGILRDDAHGAANARGVIPKANDESLSPYGREVAAGLRAKTRGLHLTEDKLVSAGMARAMKTWDKHNPASNPRSHAFLSQKEIAAIAKEDANLGLLTSRAASLVEKLTPTKDKARIPVVALTEAPAGVTFEAKGDLFTFTTTKPEASAPMKLVVDGHEIAMTRHLGGFANYELGGSMPEGFGAEEVDSERLADGGFRSIVRITRDKPGWISDADAYANAREALTEYIKNERVKDSDWKDMMGETWDEAVAAGILDSIAKFAVPTGPEDSANGIDRSPDTLQFVGEVLGLYTEVEVSKKNGLVGRTYVELD